MTWEPWMTWSTPTNLEALEMTMAVLYRWHPGVFPRRPWPINFKAQTHEATQWFVHSASLASDVFHNDLLLEWLLCLKDM